LSCVWAADWAGLGAAKRGDLDFAGLRVILWELYLVRGRIWGEQSERGWRS